MYLLESSAAKYTLYKKKHFGLIFLSAKDYTRENNCLRDLQESSVVLVCQHLFNRQRKNKKNFMQMYTGTRLTTVIYRRLSPRFFTEGTGGVCTQANIRMPFTTSAKLLLPGKH